jgi:hypothetical protein
MSFIKNSFLILVSFILARPIPCRASDETSVLAVADSAEVVAVADPIAADGYQPMEKKRFMKTIYAHPYSVTYRDPDWHRLWINTAVLSGGFIGALFVLDALPDDATAWDHDQIHSQPPFKRWYHNVFKRGPEWDSDKFYFNFLLHPYAGATYFMTARSCGFNMWQSLLYCTCASTIGWEFGVEAFMERPSYQDLFITPLLGSAIGEGFYRLKRHIAARGYRLAGSKVLGNVVAFIIDPVNEVVGLFAGNGARNISDSSSAGHEIAMSPLVSPGLKGFSISATF